MKYTPLVIVSYEFNNRFALLKKSRKEDVMCRFTVFLVLLVSIISKPAMASMPISSPWGGGGGGKNN
ncbi:MAG: hypothetical protein WC528_04510, partial [Patescibacteria group bacterium]